MKSKYLFLILIVLSFFFSCSQEDELVIPEKPFENSALELEQAKLAIYAMGFDSAFVTEWDNYYIVEEDILICKDSLNIVSTRQYRTNNYVDNLQSLTIGVDNTIAQSTNWREAVKEVVRLYNDYTGLTISYSEYNPDVKITKKNISGTDVCAMGVFPSSSKKPGKEIFINSSFYTNIDTYLTLKQKIFLLMHELGHNLGLRHTDCFMKGEGNGSYGMVKIPNTPEIDQVSYMNSNTCGLNWNGMPFYDAVALKELWPIRCTLSFYGNKNSASFYKGDSVQLSWYHIPDVIPDSKQFGGWYYDYGLTDECRYGTYIKDDTMLYPKWRSGNGYVSVTEFSSDHPNGNQYMTIEQNTIVTVTCTVKRAFNEWIDIYRHPKETGGVITSYGHWPFVTVQFWMEEYMVGPLTTDVVTHTWKVFLPAGTYIYDAYFSKSLGTQNDGPYEKHGTTRIDISYYN